ncbi:MAG TPA: MBL fold metallo-hydrolase [Amycolatopsis sp.]|nr:MBL fold metallo-hydrolase [Amycolatopsis sp.]
MPNVEVLETSSLGDRSYVVHDGSTALVVDPQRDIDRVESALSDRGLSCAAVLETHIHNDYVSGGLELARRTGAGYLVNAEDPVRFDRTAVVDGDRFAFGSLRVEVMATPGHTVTHLSYLVTDASGDGEPAVFTGGSLLYGSVGRTDLVDPGLTESLTRAQYRSARKLAELPAATRLFPTHGFGSFCSSGAATGGGSSTIGDELARNDALTASDEDAFVAALIANLTAYPAYYAHMGARNLAGGGPIDLSPPELADPDQLRKRIDAGEWVVDLRTRTAYAAGHLAGTVGIELGDQFSTYLGWLIPWGTPVSLIGDTLDQVGQAQRQLVRIGIDRPETAAVGDPAQLARQAGDIRGYDIATFPDLRELSAAQRDFIAVLDVRRDEERSGGAVVRALHIPLHEIVTRLDEIADCGKPVWVHCASGYRASIAASFLSRAGLAVTLIDDDFARAKDLGLA